MFNFIANNDIDQFPPIEEAWDGIVALGGQLTTARLLSAYRQGIFPWSSINQPLMWWSPDPRMLMRPEEVKISKSMRKILARAEFKITLDTAFEEVIRNCASIPRPGQEPLEGEESGAWLTEEMQEAYINLHKAGHAHSVEAWQDGQLVGGLYGVAVGWNFSGESMFAKVSNASKAAYLTLVPLLGQLGFQWIDCQMYTEHLSSLGARLYPRQMYLDFLKENEQEEGIQGSWTHLL